VAASFFFFFFSRMCECTAFFIEKQKNTQAGARARSPTKMGPPSGLPTSTGTSRVLWEANAGSAWRALHHPFVRALADGSLPRPNFRFYVQQDAAFLQAFAEAYEAARAAADEAGDTEAVGVLTQLRAAVTDELRLHEKYAGGWGLSVADLAAPAAPATTAYTAFLAGAGQAAGSDAPGLARVSCILAAMAPCSRLYGWLGCSLAAAGVIIGRADRASSPPSSHPYADWIATYSSPEYLSAPAAKEALLDRVAGAADAGEREEVDGWMERARLAQRGAAPPRSHSFDWLGAEPSTQQKKAMRAPSERAGIAPRASARLPTRGGHRPVGAGPARRLASSAAPAAASAGRRDAFTARRAHTGGAFGLDLFTTGAWACGAHTGMRGTPC
jgi:thiaminase (transcriptional activator TenA)